MDYFRDLEDVIDVDIFMEMVIIAMYLLEATKMFWGR